MSTLVVITHFGNLLSIDGRRAGGEYHQEKAFLMLSQLTTMAGRTSGLATRVEGRHESVSRNHSIISRRYDLGKVRPHGRFRTLPRMVITASGCPRVYVHDTRVHRAPFSEMRGHFPFRLFEVFPMEVLTTFCRLALRLWLALKKSRENPGNPGNFPGSSWGILLLEVR